MNYAHFAEYVRTVEDDLVQKFGVSRAGAKRITTRLEVDAAKDYIDTKDRNQLILEYKELGPVRLAEITGKSREYLRQKYNEACANESPMKIAI